MGDTGRYRRVLFEAMELRTKDGARYSPFTERVIAVLQAIPPGRVTCYRDVAAMAGNPQGARQVSRIIHSLSRKLGLPWHRVVNVSGAIAIREPEGRKLQQSKLEAEGVEFLSPGQTDWAKVRWNGGSIGRSDVLE